MFFKNSRIFIISVVIILIINVFVSSQNVTSIKQNSNAKTIGDKSPIVTKSTTTISRSNNLRSTNSASNSKSINSSSDNSSSSNSSSSNDKDLNKSSSTTTASKSINSMNTNKAVSDIKSLNDYLNSINFKFIEPQNNTVINPNSSFNVKWECNTSNIKNNYNITFVLQSLNHLDNDINSTNIDLNLKEYKYPIFALNTSEQNYILKVYTPDLPENANYYDGPTLTNSNYLNNTVKASSLNVSYVNEPKDDDNGSGIKTRIILIAVITVLIIAIVAVIAIYGRNKKNSSRESQNFKEYNEYKGYSNVSPSVNQLLGINEYYDPKIAERQRQIQMMSNNSSTSSVNSLAEQIHKAEQVYSNKVFNNPNLNEMDEHCAPLVDMSSLYKSTQEILNKKMGTNENDINPDNLYYGRKPLNQNQRVDYNNNMTNNNTNKTNDLVNSSNYSMNNDSNNSKDISTDEDYLNKNSFCLNTSRDSSEAFENIYLSKQNDYQSDNSTMRPDSPLVATVTTVEEFLATHPISKETRHRRTSSLISSTSSNYRDSIIGNSNFNVIPNMNITNNNKFNLSNVYKSSPLNPKNTNEDEPKKSDNMIRVSVSGSDYNSNSLVDSSMNSSLLEELNLLEKQIQQQKLMYNTQINSPSLPQDLNKIGSTQQQNFENNQYLLGTGNNNNSNNNNKYTVPLSTPLSFIASPAQAKSLAIGSPSQSITPPQSKSNLPVQSILKNKMSPQSTSSNSPYSNSPSGRMSKNLKNGTEVLSDNIIQKSQESEMTLHAQQGTQETISYDDNDDEVETIVATHVCNAWYSPKMPDELRMCPGDELIILETFNDGWGFGQNTKGNVGVFPLDCVSYIDYNKINNNSNDSFLINNYENNETNINHIDINGNYTNNNGNNNVNNNKGNHDMKNNVSSKSNLNPNYNLNEDIQPSKAMIFDTNDLCDSDDNSDDGTSNIINEYQDYFNDNDNNNMNDISVNQSSYQKNYTKNMINSDKNKYGGVTFNNMPNKYY